MPTYGARPYEARPLELRVARYEKGLSVSQVAELAGVSARTYLTWEQGGVPREYETQIRVARVLGREPDDFWPVADAVA
jgi:transcriptional regulator with XRE-family HTH domain